MYLGVWLQTLGGGDRREGEGGKSEREREREEKNDRWMGEGERERGSRANKNVVKGSVNDSKEHTMWCALIINWQ